MKIEVLNNTLSPSFVIKTEEKNILVNCPKGFYKNLDCKIDELIITFPDRYHIYDLDKLKFFQSKEIIECFILKEFEFDIKQKFKQVDLVFNYVIPYKDFNGITPVLLHKDDRSSLGLIVDEITILPAFTKLTKRTEEMLTKRVLVSAKYKKDIGRNDFCSVADVLEIAQNPRVEDIGLIGISNLLKELFLDTVVEVRKSANINKIYSKEYFLYLCKEVLMNKTFVSKDVRFDYITTIKSEKKESDFFIVGYATTPALDRHYEVITIEAIKKAEKDLLQPQNSTLFLNHNYDRPIGKVVESKFTEKGLLVKAKISATETKIRQQIEEGLWTSFSIGGIIKGIEEGTDEDDKILKITSIELVELSLVGVPANPEANLISVLTKSLDKLKSEKGGKEQVKKTEENKKEEVVIDPKARGDGQGQGNEPQGDGGADICICPKCGTTVPHEKGVPCNELECPNCGEKLIGKDIEGTKEKIEEEKEEEETKEEEVEEDLDSKEKEEEQKEEEETKEEEKEELEENKEEAFDFKAAFDTILNKLTVIEEKFAALSKVLVKETQTDDDLKVPDNTDKKAEEESAIRKGVVKDENKKEENELIKKIEGMTPMEIMNDSEIWGLLDEGIKTRIMSNYMRRIF